MTRQDDDLNRAHLELKAKANDLKWEYAQKAFEVKIGAHVKGRQYEDMRRVFDNEKLDRKYAWAIITAFDRALYAHPSGGEPKLREPLERAGRLTKIMKRLEGFLENYNPHAGRLIVVKRSGEFVIGPVEELLIEIWQNDLHETPPVNLG